MTPMVIAIAITVITAAIIIAFWVTMFRTFRRSSHIMLFIWCAILSAALYGCANLVSLRLTAPTVAQSLAASGIQPRQSYALSVGTNRDDSHQPVWAILDPSSYDGRTARMYLHVRQGDSILTCTIPVQRQSIDRDADINPPASSVTFLIYKNAPSGVKARHFAGVLYDQATDYGGCVGLVLAITGSDVHPVIALSAQDRSRLERSS
ncbi:hypothetical protein EUA66_00145 [TM7 phylum sp. oral taxon 349]|nr:hypothetical protein EUA66_00145 [TM7 phylum sp. oral taxon 349]